MSNKTATATAGCLQPISFAYDKRRLTHQRPGAIVSWKHQGAECLGGFCHGVHDQQVCHASVLRPAPKNVLRNHDPIRRLDVVAEIMKQRAFEVVDSMTSAPVFAGSSVGKAFADTDGTVVAFECADFSIPRGRFVTLIGPSGCGKSALLWLIALLIPPTSDQTGRDQPTPGRRLDVPTSHTAGAASGC